MTLNIKNGKIKKNNPRGGIFMNRIIRVFAVIKRITVSAMICWALAWLISLLNAVFTYFVWCTNLSYELIQLTQQKLAVAFYVSFWTLYVIANEDEE